MHRGKVDHQATVADGATAYIVAATSDRDEKVMFSRKTDHLDDIFDARASRDQRRALVDQPVPNPACVVVTLVFSPIRLPLKCLLNFSRTPELKCAVPPSVVLSRVMCGLHLVP
jgi:hypothetical protein